MKTQHALGAKIKEARQNKKISQLELEIEIHMSSGTISRIENGKIKISKQTLLKIISYLNLSESESQELLKLI